MRKIDQTSNLDQWNIYDTEFYKDRYSETQHAARTVLEIVNNIIEFKSVVDIGCGVGAWLSIAESLGADDIYGVDGEWVDTREIVVDLEHFAAVDLERLEVAHFQSRKYDLALSLEVIEHLTPSGGEALIKTLCHLSDVVLFSAAIPGQGGFGHINEQWLSYWQERFNERGYIMHDVIRPAIWNDKDIGRWYRQNCVLFIKAEKSNSILSSNKLISNGISDIVHPDIFTDYRYANFGVRHNLKMLFQSLRSAFQRRIKLSR